MTFNVVHKLIEGLEVDYLGGGGADVAVFVLALFLTGSRREETFNIVLSETKNFFDEGQAHRNQKYVILPLRGRFKRESNENYHLIEVTDKSNSGW